ncbi:MAG: T9SS type A sorting domain-containing protein [Melioribacteraceae bacterium]|nr:T9SS type A sorting domain-containing protein [Melioribacteraceae bacterium]MCF8355092.1 T9SS type A sorting domain-containing protein [Melioribacteraceae bacterium]MCF8395060.1 T9SS type A sorting domain-containing protein [Melioribacteraceae bacterium]MCF8420310.1 T9SS type A sorting domain-containing protein [Melioribacteraceae bacterium]
MERKKMIFLILFWGLLIILNNLTAQENYATNDGGRTYYQSYDIEMDTIESQPSSSEYLLVKEVLGLQTPMAFGDADHDGNLEVYFPSSGANPVLRVWEFNDDLSYAEFDLPYYGFPWDVGDIDDNGLIDLVVQGGDHGGICEGNGYLRIYESPNAHSFPTVLKDEVVMPGRKLSYHAKIVDTDKDGKKEVLLGANFVSTDCGDSEMRIYEWEKIALELKWTSPNIIRPTYTKTIADFDGDDNIEIATVESSGYSETVYVYETNGDNLYNLVQSWSMSPYRSETVPSTDVDGGNPELVVGGSSIPYNHYVWTFYKESQHNIFSEWWTTDFALSNYRFNPRHTSGDYDADDLDEVLVLDYPTFKILEYENSQMQVNWTTDMYKPWAAYSADFRMDGYMNFVTINIASNYQNALKIWEAAFVTLPPETPANFTGTTYDNHPKLNWSLNNEPDIAGYEIYSKLTGGSGVYELLTTVSASSSYFVDYGVTLGGPFSGVVYYKVRAKDNNPYYSNYTNEVGYRYSYLSKKTLLVGVLDYQLNSNFPNPFNPSTQISYSLADDADVTLRVYDVLGTQVAELVNELQAVGNHIINFNADNLSSGVYIYRIIASKNERLLFTDTKQMIILK